MITDWHDFFVMVGGSAAVLTGLVFVAMSLNLEAILREETHRRRALGTLAGFTGVFVICSFALMGSQSYPTTGAGWLAVSLVTGCVYIHGAYRARTKGTSAIGLGNLRLLVGASLYLCEIVGSTLLVLEHETGLYMASIAMVLLLSYTITGAWLLVVGVYGETADDPTG